MRAPTGTFALAAVHDRLNVQVFIHSPDAARRRLQIALMMFTMCMCCLTTQTLPRRQSVTAAAPVPVDHLHPMLTCLCSMHGF